MADRHLPFCSIVDLDVSSLCYRVCRICESIVSDTSGRLSCVSCGSCITGRGTKLLYRLQLSIATEDEVFPVVAFDRAAHKLMGCSADVFSHFASSNPFTAENVRKIILGEMVQMTLRPPKSGHAQHMRVISMVPLAPHFQHVMDALHKIYGIQGKPSDGLLSGAHLLPRTSRAGLHM